MPPAITTKLTKITQLNLSSCYKIKKIPPISALTSLQMLKLDNCADLESLPEEWAPLSSLWSIDLDECRKLTALPAGWSSLSALERLKLKNLWCVARVPDLSALTELKIEGLPEHLKEWKEGGHKAGVYKARKVERD